jgi:hypothetical protein
MGAYAWMPLYSSKRPRFADIALKILLYNKPTGLPVKLFAFCME